MSTEIPLIQSVLFQSPYSGCRCFSGWKSAPCQKMPVQTSWPSPYNAPGARLCHDPVWRRPPGPQNVQQVAFRPSAPYPGYVLGPGNEPLQPMPKIVRPVVGRPKTGKFLCAGPSASGPFTYGIATGIDAGGMRFVVGTGGNSQHNLGYT